MNSHIPGAAADVSDKLEEKRAPLFPKAFCGKHTHTPFFFSVVEEGDKFCVWAEKVLSRVYI